MATATLQFPPENAVFPAATFAQYLTIYGTNFPYGVLAFDAGLDEAAHWVCEATSYLSGNPSFSIKWYADTASTGDVVWEVTIAAITPNTDSGDIETKALATIQKATDSHLGTTGQRLHEITISITNLDSLAAGDVVFIRVRRLGSTDAADTMTGDALLVIATLTYTTA